MAHYQNGWTYGFAVMTLDQTRITALLPDLLSAAHVLERFRVKRLAPSGLVAHIWRV